MARFLPPPRGVGFLATNIVKIASYSDTHDSLRLADSVCGESSGFGKPMNLYLAGISGGVIQSLLNKSVKCTETRCMAKGDECCEFECRETGQ